MQNTGARVGATSSGFGRCAAALAFALAAAALPALAAAQASDSQPGAGPVAALRGQAQSPEVRSLARWALASGDTGGLPFVIVDKPDSQVFVFEADGRLRGASPALVGAARGDDNVPGIGKRPIASIRPEERITPAGRFTAVMGRGPKGEDILWVDYDSALALHRVVTNVPQERRLERLKSKVAAERRITYGCINVPVAFYEGVVRPTFEGTRGIVYILPDSKPLQDVFASFGTWAKVSQAPGAAPTVH
jgi:hypothetical protein